MVQMIKRFSVVQMIKITFPFFFPFLPRPLIGGAGIAGRSHSFPFRDISGIAGKVECYDLLGDDLPIHKNALPGIVAHGQSETPPGDKTKPKGN